MNLRTDLIAEIKAEKALNLSGIKSDDEKIGEVSVSTVEVLNDEAAQLLEKPIGTYCTVYFPRLDFVCDTADIIKATVKSFKKVCEKSIESALVVGLGNVDITPDALGPMVCNEVLATRHLTNQLKKDLGLEKLKSVACVFPNVLGKTGIESYDLITAAASKIKPDILIAVDALAAREPQRLCRTIQISNSGICAGSGVNNARKPLNKENVGIPVIAIGIPTVIDANSFFNTQENMMVTPKEIDLLIEKSSSVLAKAINIFLQPDLDEQIIDSLT